MIQKYVLVFILIIIVIVLFFKSLNVEHFYNKWQPWKQSDITNCKTQNPEEVEEEKDTNEDYCCSNMETKTVNYWNKANDEVERDIHIVNPRDPCCIKSCINDFTNVDCKTHSDDISNEFMCHEKTDKDGNGKEGELRPEFKNKNIHYFLTSGCYSCIKNFKGGVDLLADPDNDPNCKKTTQA